LPGTSTSTAPTSSPITSVLVSNVTEGSAEVTITVPAISSITLRYGPTTAYGQTTVASPELKTIFENLTGLTPNTVYDFIVSVTPEGTTTPFTSQNYVFTTSSTPPPAPTGGGGGGGGGGYYIPPVVASTSHASSTSGTPVPISSAPTPVTIPPIFPRNLAFGDTGPDVTLLQTTLKNLGFFNATTTITQTFGQFTEHAVLLFQNAHDINMSGFLDTQTQTLLDKVVAADPSVAGLSGLPGLTATSTVATSTPASTPTPGSGSLNPSSFPKNLGPGSTGAEVTLLQQTLFHDGDYPQDIVTGYYGNLTEQAVKAFQAKYGIVDYGSPATTGYGAVGPRTRRELDGV
jgi:peptidoglycan hydrolase-like protein with peptidoglycan-binding domain